MEVSGLPFGVDSNVEAVAPDGNSQGISSNLPPRLQPGPYFIRVNDLDVNGTHYVGAATPNILTVNAGAATSVKVYYGRQ